MRAGIVKAVSGSVVIALALLGVALRPAAALDVVLDDVAPDRVQRQRSFIRNELPLPGTPDLARLDERLKAEGLVEGSAIYIRIFKAESELELWMQNSKGTFTRLATYPICHWYGSLGPKLKEGDKQSPEGFYTVGAPQTRLVGRWRKAFNLGFPNVLDQRLGRTGSYILIHGGCSSVGCFAMTDPVQDEIYRLARAALARAQDRFSVHVFPFRMTPENMARHAEHEAAETWADLKPAYDSFERTQVPPRVVVCGMRYKIADGLPGETGDAERRMPVLQPASGGTRPAAQEAGRMESDWQAPACRLDDEDERIAYYSAPITTSATTTASSIAVAAPTEDEKPVYAPKPKTAAAVANRAEPVAPQTARRPVPVRMKRAEIEYEAPRVRVPQRPRAATRRPSQREGGSEPRLSGAGTPASDGFGSSALRGTQRISAHGG